MIRRVCIVQPGSCKVDGANFDLGHPIEVDVKQAIFPLNARSVKFHYKHKTLEVPANRVTVLTLDQHSNVIDTATVEEFIRQTRSHKNFAWRASHGS